MVKGFVKAGFDVDVITGMPNYPKGKIYPSYQKKIFVQEKEGKVTIRRHWLYASHNDRMLSRLLTMISLSITVLRSLMHVIRRKPDFIIVQYPPVILPVSAWLMAKIVGAKFVINVSDLWPSAIYDLGIIKKKGFLYKLLDFWETWLYRQTDFCIAQSEEIITHIRQKVSVPVTLFRTGVDCSLFQPKNTYTNKSRKLRIVYTGVLGVAHGVYDLCKQVNFAALNAELHIYGAGFEYPKIEALVAQEPDRGVFLHGFVPNEQVPQIINQYEVALICQKKRVYGTVPSKMYEAMASGLPILFHGAGEGADIIQTYQAGLVSCPQDYDTLQQQIEHLQTLAFSELKTLGVNGRAAAEKHFNRKIAIQQLVQYIKDW